MLGRKSIFHCCDFSEWQTCSTADSCHRDSWQREPMSGGVNCKQQAVDSESERCLLFTLLSSGDFTVLCASLLLI